MKSPGQIYGADRYARLSGVLPYIVAGTFFMEYLDTTIIATALPQMARSFSVGPNELSLGLTAYMLALAVFIPVSGWIADRFGSRTVFGAALMVFTLASILCGLSTGVGWFTAARILQGMGGAMMVPVGRMIVVRNTDKSRLMQALSTITWPGIVAPVVGPTVGGFITTYASWRWSFFLNVPFGLLALIAILWVVPNQKDERRRRLDLLGFALSGVALTSILYGTELASHTDASMIRAACFFAFGTGMGLWAWRHLLRVKDPLMDLQALGCQSFSTSVFWGSATRIGAEAVPYLSPLLFQIGFGLSAFHSGLLLMATALGNLGMKAFTTPILRTFGFRPVAIINGTLAGICIIACGWLMPTTPLLLSLFVLFCYGLARSLQFTTLATLAYADVTDEQKGPASTVWSVTQQMTIGMGIAVGALCLRASSVLHRSLYGDASFLAGQQFVLRDFRWAFMMAGALTLFSVIGYVRLPHDVGASLGGGMRRTKQGDLRS